MILICIVFLGCGKNEIPKASLKLHDLLENHIYSHNIDCKIVKTIDGKTQTFESSFYVTLQGFIKSIAVYEEVKEIKDSNWEDHIKKIEEKEYMIINSTSNNSVLKLFISSNGKVIIEKDDVLYETSEECIDFNDLIQLSTLNFSKESLEDLFGGVFSYAEYKNTTYVRKSINYRDSVLQEGYDKYIQDGRDPKDFLINYRNKLYIEYLYNLLDQDRLLLKTKYYTYDFPEILLRNTNDSFDDIVTPYEIDFNTNCVPRYGIMYIYENGVLLYDAKDDWYYFYDDSFVSYNEFIDLFYFNVKELNDKIDEFKIEHGIE